MAACYPARTRSAAPGKVHDKPSRSALPTTGTKTTGSAKPTLNKGTKDSGSSNRGRNMGTKSGLGLAKR